MFGIGYEGLPVDELITKLKEQRTDIVVDVRLNAISRKAGYSKRALGTALEASGIRYIHERRLGNPRENRAAYAEPSSIDGAAARNHFRELLTTEAASEGVKTLAELSEDHTVAVLCYEASETHCHREQVIAAAHELRSSPVRG